MTAYEMRISDWSSDVCASDLGAAAIGEEAQFDRGEREFVAKLRIGAAKLARDAVERGIDGQAGLGADAKQVERVGKALADRVRALGDQVLHVEIRGLVRQAQQIGRASGRE